MDKSRGLGGCKPGRHDKPAPTLPTLVSEDIEYKNPRVTGGCNSDSQGSPLATDTATTASCRSRYNSADMVGNVREWVTDRHYTGAAFDNGTDGLWLGQSLPTGSSLISTLGGKFDLLRGLVVSSGVGHAVSSNADYYQYKTDLRVALRGGSWNYNSYAGRWSLSVFYAPSAVGTFIGGRCAR